MKRFFTLLIAMLGAISTLLAYEQLYLVGERTGWGHYNNYELITTDGDYYEATYPSGEEIELYGEFKLSDPTWRVYNFGGNLNIEAGTSYKLTVAGANLTIGGKLLVSKIEFRISTQTLKIIGTQIMDPIFSQGLEETEYCFNRDGIYYSVEKANGTATVLGHDMSTPNVVIPSSVVYQSKNYEVTSIIDKGFNTNRACDYERILPRIPAPSINETTLLFHIRNANCVGFELYLLGLNGVWEDTEETKFSRVPGTSCWFQLTVPALDETQENFKIRANGDWTYDPQEGYKFYGDTHEYSGENSEGPNYLKMLKEAGGKILAFDVVSFRTPCWGVGEEAAYDEEENIYAKSLASITLPSTIKSIGADAFYECENLNKVNYLGTADQWVDIDFYETKIEQGSGQSFYNSNPIRNSKNLYINNKLLTDVKIISADTIKDYAFYGLESLESIELGKSVKHIGYNSFNGCNNLKKVNYLGDVERWASIEFETNSDYYSSVSSNPATLVGDLYINNKLLTDVKISSLDSIKDYAFENLGSIKSVELGNSVKYIGSYAFVGTSITALTIPNSVEVIEGAAFAECDKLQDVVIGSGVKKLEGTFSYCDNLNTITIGEGIEEIWGAFYGCEKIKKVIAYPKTVPVAESAFSHYNAYLYVPCESFDDYDLDAVWGSFKHIKCLSADETDAPEDVEVNVNNNTSVTVTWPSVDGAKGYELVISKDKVVFCTLKFDENGQLVSIDFGNRSASVGFTFTVTGLDQESDYKYVFTSLNKSGSVIEKSEGNFTTKCETGVIETLADANISISEGTISCINLDFIIYNVAGQNVTALNGSLTPGVYVVQIGEDRVKVMVP